MILKSQISVYGIVGSTIAVLGTLVTSPNSNALALQPNSYLALPHSNHPNLTLTSPYPILCCLQAYALAQYYADKNNAALIRKVKPSAMIAKQPNIV